MISTAIMIPVGTATIGSTTALAHQVADSKSVSQKVVTKKTTPTKIRAIESHRALADYRNAQKAVQQAKTALKKANTAHRQSTQARHAEMHKKARVARQDVTRKVAAANAAKERYNVAAARSDADRTQPTRASRNKPRTPLRAPELASNAVWDLLAQCESGGNWNINTGNGYYGGLQFSHGTWLSVGGSGMAHQNSRDEQIKRGKILQEKSGWQPWPGCTKKLGLR